MSADLIPYLEKYKDNAGPILQIYNDLVLGHKWNQMKLLDSPDGLLFYGISPLKPKTVQFVWPIARDATMSVLLIHSIISYCHSYASANSGDLSYDSDTVLSGVAERDGSCVYYTLTNGVVSPAEVPV